MSTELDVFESALQAVKEKIDLHETIKEEVAARASQSDKTAWKRRQNNLEKVIGEMTPIEQQILELSLKKRPYLEEIERIRAEMVELCIHPAETLVVKGEAPNSHHVVLCKFCNKSFTVKQ